VGNIEINEHDNRTGLFPHIPQPACTIFTTFFFLVYLSLCLINLSVRCPVDGASIPPRYFQTINVPVQPSWRRSRRTMHMRGRWQKGSERITVRTFSILSLYFTDTKCHFIRSRYCHCRCEREIPQLVVPVYKIFLHKYLYYSVRNMYTKFQLKFIGCGHTMT